MLKKKKNTACTLHYITRFVRCIIHNRRRKGKTFTLSCDSGKYYTTRVFPRLETVFKIYIQIYKILKPHAKFETKTKTFYSVSSRVFFNRIPSTPRCCELSAATNTSKSETSNSVKFRDFYSVLGKISALLCASIELYVKSLSCRATATCFVLMILHNTHCSQRHNVYIRTMRVNIIL